MKQLEIEYFFPLTEQMSLDLDYTPCNAHTYYIKAQGQPREGPFATGMIYKDACTTTWGSTINSPGLTIDSGTLTIKGRPMPWYRKTLFKMLGFKYE
jgi:hypothetical protein